MSSNFAYSLCVEGTHTERAMYALEVQKFDYTDVSYAKYSERYEPCPEGAILLKKMIAPISAFGYGVVHSIYRFAKAFFIGVPKYLFLGDSSTIKCHTYTAVRDLEHGYGWMATIFNDRYGSFLIEDAQHHKALYKYFLDDRLV